MTSSVLLGRRPFSSSRIASFLQWLTTSLRFPCWARRSPGRVTACWGVGADFRSLNVVLAQTRHRKPTTQRRNNPRLRENDLRIHTATTPRCRMGACLVSYSLSLSSAMVSKQVFAPRVDFWIDGSGWGCTLGTIVNGPLIGNYSLLEPQIIGRSMIDYRYHTISLKPRHVQE